MTDRLPVPMLDPSSEAITERASATPERKRPALRSAEVAVSRARAPLPEALADTERWLLDAIVGAEPSASDVDAVLTSSPRLSAIERFDVYRAGYRARLVECLRDDYPAIAHAVGDERFDALAQAYCEKNPSRSPSLNAFGRHMAAFCRGGLPFSDVAKDFLADLASLEWAIVESIHAEAAAPFDFQALRSVPVDAWGGARLHRSDTVRVLSFEYPVNAYFQAVREGRSPEHPKPTWSATAVYRRGFVVWRMDLTRAMESVLEALLAGAPIGDALARLSIDETDSIALAEAERTVMLWFREWVEAGFFSGVTLATT